MSDFQRNMSLTGEPPKSLTPGQKISTAVGFFGLAVLILANFNVNFPNKTLWLTIALSSILLGVIGFSWASYAGKNAGIKNDGVMFKSFTSRGLLAWIGILTLSGFYVILYFYPEYLGLVQDGENTGVIALFDPLSQLLSGQPASQWFVYGVFYTLAIVSFGIKFIWKYRHNRYEIIRTISVMFFQTSFAFMIPQIMISLNQPYYDFKNVWPLNYDLFAGYRLDQFLSAGNFGVAMLIFGVASILIITPILTFKYGKRWYCSWVCGCGGLAETAGDPFRHLSNKKLYAWNIERWVVHSVVVFVVVMTTAVVYSYLKGNESASSIGSWNDFSDKVVFIGAQDQKPIHEVVLAAQEAGASRVVYVDRSESESPIELASKEDINIPFHVVNEENNAGSIQKIKEQKQATLVPVDESKSAFTIVEGTQSAFFDNVWLSKEAFVWGVIGLLTLIFGLVFIFRRDRLAKDAKIGAIGYFVIVIGLLLFTYFDPSTNLFLFESWKLNQFYGFLIGAIFSGVIGTGFYPIFGNRVWCRFGCPMAAILGFQQRMFSRFRITTNGGQCISCGNCSVYCEMGIDVRAYAQKGENIIRSSCVGCGICSAVCPRGVLKLENGPLEGRINSDAVLQGQDPDLMALLSNNKNS
ncbi:4Fe-4S binding protein [Nonlabens marinus]|uniref:Iron-sulfur cluster-binding protein n=1 Tax=Nonlabens marinus S1-08 TaxID=1454201 RepID=W8VPV8_9FLAO|nr:4Fe-4S dicluster domain-containing protein [Nonlabens marinus]BAO55294.1 iron-sulfur cluster-binding protein [Nonlabens marinus S1-08]